MSHRCQEVISLKVIDSHCPGCSILCGLHIIEDGDEIDIDFQKYCPINSGKLCKFGIDLPAIYKNCVETCMVDGELVCKDECISAASRALKSWSSRSKGKNGLVLCLGDATNEELLSLKDFANALGMKCSSGLGHFVGNITNVPLFHDFTGFDIIENSKNIILISLDPYYQYPLVARKLQMAKERGSCISSIGPEGSHLETICENIDLCRPNEVLKRLRELSQHVDRFSLFITQLGIYADPSIVAEINNICSRTSSRVKYLKDYANSEASLAMGFDNYGKSIDEIVSEMESGVITALILVESPLFDTYLDNDRFMKACEKLDTLVVIQSSMPKNLPSNAVLVPLEAFYRRKGTLINVCGRFISMGGDLEGTPDVLRKIMAGLSSAPIGSFLDLTKRSREAYDSWSANNIGYEIVSVPEHKALEGENIHLYVTNPYLLRGMGHQLVKRVGDRLYPEMLKKERYVVKQRVADGVVLSYQRDRRFKGIMGLYE